MVQKLYLTKHTEGFWQIGRPENQDDLIKNEEFWCLVYVNTDKKCVGQFLIHQVRPRIFQLLNLPYPGYLICKPDHRFWIIINDPAVPCAAEFWTCISRFVVPTSFALTQVYRVTGWRSDIFEGCWPKTGMPHHEHSRVFNLYHNSEALHRIFMLNSSQRST